MFVLSKQIVCNIGCKQKSRRMGWSGHVTYMGEIRNTHTSFVGKSERKRPPDRSRRRWKDSVRVWTGFF